MGEECCGNCKWLENDDVCTCEDSEAYGLSTSWDDYCGEFDEREQD